MRATVLIIDPQNDFCEPNGSLFVPGSAQDCLRLSDFIRKHAAQIDSIHVTLDAHPTYHIAHPVFWKCKDGSVPAPYTQITHESFKNSAYVPADPSLVSAVDKYLLQLESRGRYTLTLWPPHCRTASYGACVEKNVRAAVDSWEMTHLVKNVNYFAKAGNPLTEHYSAVSAEVPDPEDSSTRTNFALIDQLKKADVIYVAGEALSHCVANTVRDLSAYMPLSKFVLLTDCCSNVTGFENAGMTFVHECTAKGMRTEKSADISSL